MEREGEREIEHTKLAFLHETLNDRKFCVQRSPSTTQHNDVLCVASGLSMLNVSFAKKNGNKLSNVNRRQIHGNESCLWESVDDFPLVIGQTNKIELAPSFTRIIFLSFACLLEYKKMNENGRKSVYVWMCIFVHVYNEIHKMNGHTFSLTLTSN